MMILDENQVAAAVCGWLEQRQFSAMRLNAGQIGFDISAINPDTGEHWLIEAKGATSSRPGSASFGKEYGSNAAFNCVASAFLTAISWTERSDLVGKKIGIALPSTRWFDIHAPKIVRTCSTIGVTIFTVSSSAEVSLSGHIPQFS